MIALRTSALPILTLLLSACPKQEIDLPLQDSGSELPADGGLATDSGLASTGGCRPCINQDDCPPGQACLEIGGAERCARLCASAESCGADETCEATTAVDSTPIRACLPKSGSCTTSGCGICQTGEVCDAKLGECVRVQGDAGAPPEERCGSLVGPDVVASCHACGDANCQANGCYNGYWCDLSSSRCTPPVAPCDDPDAGPIEGTVFPDGGVVSRLYFAMTSDTQPGELDDTAGYPTAIIQTVFDDLQGMSPRPQFMIAGGDYMFASTTGSQAEVQTKIYAAAAARFAGPIFPAMGNHECTGYTRDNCIGSAATANLIAYRTWILAPSGQQSLYYTVPLGASDGSWTAKLIVIACNAWDSTQKSWLTGELAKTTTYTVVVRHEPSSATAAPCVPEVNSLLAAYPYDLLLAGHIHDFSHSGKEIVAGIGGAPMASNAQGYIVVEQQKTGFRVTRYHYATKAILETFLVPF